MIEIEVKGLDEFTKKFASLPDALGRGMKVFFEKAATKVEEKAKRQTPVFTGQLRASIAHKLDASPIPLWASVGTNVFYAPYVELGTRPHWPPRAALQVWADRHGIPVFLVMRAIARRGTPAKRMLQGGLEESMDDINRYLIEAGNHLQQEWDR